MISNIGTRVAETTWSQAVLMIPSLDKKICNKPTIERNHSVSGVAHSKPSDKDVHDKDVHDKAVAVVTHHCQEICYARCHTCHPLEIYPSENFYLCEISY